MPISLKLAKNKHKLSQRFVLKKLFICNVKEKAHIMPVFHKFGETTIARVSDSSDLKQILVDTLTGYRTSPEITPIAKP